MYNRLRKHKICNLDLARDVEFTEEGLPIIKSSKLTLPDAFLPFNNALRSKNYSCGVHFYIDDYQFERVWKCPQRYIDKLSNFKCVISPDFSVYLDAPFAVNLWNIYRGRFLAALFQKNGINIIPNLSVVTHDLEKYTFSGVESGGIFAVSNVQANNYIFRHHWFNFVRNAIEKLSP